MAEEVDWEKEFDEARRQNRERLRKVVFVNLSLKKNEKYIKEWLAKKAEEKQTTMAAIAKAIIKAEMKRQGAI